MQIHLLTAHRLSEQFYTGTTSKSFQSLIQENGAASPGFLLIAIILIRELYQANLIPPSTSLILQYIYYLAGQIFIDDSDLNVMNKGKELAQEIIRRAQQILNNWHTNLQIMGG